MARIVDKIKGISKKANRIVKRGVVRNRRHTIRMSALADQFDDPNVQLTMRQRITGSVIRATEDAVLGNMGQLGSAWQRARRGERGYVKLAVKRAVYSATLGRMGYLGSAFEAKWNSRGIIIEEKDLGIPEPSQTSKTTKIKTEDVLKTLQELEDKLQKNFSNINAAFGDIAGDFKKTKEFHETILPKRIEQNIDEKVKPINEMIVTLSRKIDEIDDEKFQLENLSQRVSENESAIAQLRGEIRSELYKKKPEAVENSPVFVDPVRRTEGPAGLIPNLLKFFGIGFAGTVGIGAGAVAGGATTAGILATIKRTFTRLGPKKLAQMIGTRMAGAALGGPAAPIIGAIGLGLLAKEIYDATSNSAEAAELVDKDEINLEANRLIKMKSRKIELAADEIVLDAHNIVFKTASKVTFGSPTTKTFSAPKPSIENLEQQQTPIKPVQPPQPMPSLGGMETGPIQSDMGIQSTPMQRPGASITQSYGTNGANVPGMISKISVPENVSAFNPGDVRPGSRYNQINIPYDGRSAAVRYNNPAAQYPSRHAEKFGMEGFGIIGGGHKIAKFPSDAHGAAANMDNFARNYKGLTISQAVRKWRGPNVGNNLIPTGYDPNMVIDDNFLNNRDMMIDFFKKMSKHEGRKGGKPISDEMWYHAFGMYSAGGVKEYKKVLEKQGMELPKELQIAGPTAGPTGGQLIANQTEQKSSQEKISGPINVTREQQVNRPSYFKGTLELEGEKYEYGTGGGGRGSVPLGTHEINGLRTWSNNPRFVNNSFEVKDMFDPKVGGTRRGILIHSARDLEKLRSLGCIAIRKDQWPKFKKHLLDYMKRNGNKLHLHIRPDGSASITPRALPGTMPSSVDNFSKKIPEPVKNELQQSAVERGIITPGESKTIMAKENIGPPPAIETPKPISPAPLLDGKETGISEGQLVNPVSPEKKLLPMDGQFSPKPEPPPETKPEELASKPKYDEAKTNEPPLEFEPETKAEEKVSETPTQTDYGTDAPTVSAPYYNPESAAPEPGDNGYGEYKRCLI